MPSASRQVAESGNVSLVMIRSPACVPVRRLMALKILAKEPDGCCARTLRNVRMTIHVRGKSGRPGKTLSLRDLRLALFFCLAGISSFSAAQSSDLPLSASAFAADPYHEGIFYLAPQEAPGLLRSSDGGLTWSRVGPLQLIRRILVLQDRVYASDGGSLYTSSDGKVWSPATAPVGTSINFFDASPFSSDVVYGGAPGAVVRSPDAGTHWLATSPVGFAYDLFTDPNSSLVYVSTDQGIFKSEDGGDAWNLFVYPFSRGSGFPYFDPSRPNVVYIKHVPYPSPCTSIDCNTLLRSDDRGISWTTLTTPDVDFSMHVAPDGTLYLLGLDQSLYVSDDEGSSWRLSVSGLSSGATRVTFSSSKSFVFTKDRRIFSSSDHGRNWVPVGKTIRSCGSDPKELCLGARFGVRVTFRLPDGRQGIATAVPMLPRSGGFWFFTPDNVEIVVKLFNTPVGSPYWVFIGSLTNLAYDVTVTDLDSGRARNYSNPQGLVSSISDLSAFDHATRAESRSISATPISLAKASTATAFRTRAATEGCTADFGTLCLQNNRFAVTFSGANAARRFKTSSSAGYGGGEDLEVALKVVDGRSFNGHFWVFVGSMTDRPYKVTILDTLTGVTWSHENPSGRFESLADILAFPG